VIEEIILATGNQHKIKEIKAILKNLCIRLIPMVSFHEYPKTIEDGKTFESNASKKAREVSKFFKKWAIADDSGLEVDYLNGYPGVYSARYAGEKCSYEDNNEKLLLELKNVPKEKRTAKFKTVIAISNPYGKIYLADGEIFGTINSRIIKKRGFGYDSIFYLPDYGKTLSELSFKVKNFISHRAVALRKAKKIIKNCNVI
jgi:XTP/dITP diphosphohydrolase